MNDDRKVFLHYTQAELDRNFDQRGWVPNALEVIGRYPGLAAATRQRLKHEANVAYGRSADEVLDIFPAATPRAPTQIFVHGGAWRNFTKDDYSFAAEAYVGNGINAVIVNFAKVLQVPLPEMVTQVHRAIAWVIRNVSRWSGDANRIYVSGHSSGAHLAAMAMIRGWASQGLGERPIKGAQLISGPYDMEPVLLSARSSYVKLRKDEERALSPVLHAARIACPVFVGYAEHDTDEFQRQSQAFAAALEKAGRLDGVRRFEGVNHFELMERFGDPQSPLVQEIVKRMS